MSQLIEPSLADYARFYGLTHNHLEVDPLAGLSVPEDAQIQLQDGPQLFNINESSASRPEEKLVLGKDEILLLASLTRDLEKSPSFDNVDLDHRRVRKMKTDLPLLSTDPELDMQNFAQTIVPDLANEHLPLESLDDEADEGLSWPSTYANLPDVYFAKCKAEKLEISPEWLNCMRDVLSLQNEHVQFEDSKLPWKKKSLIEPVTPPLLPMSPPFLPYEPSSDTGRLELVSEPISPTLQELKEVDKKLFKKDALTECQSDPLSESQDTNPMLFDSETIGDIYSPLKGIKDPPSSPPVRKATVSDLKVEVPLMPLQCEQPPPWQRKNVPHKNAVSELLPELPSPIADPEHNSSDDFNAFFKQQIAPIAVKFERAIEQEQLQEADTMYRVPVPVMDFSLPSAPWKTPDNHPGARTEVGKKEKLLEMKKTHFSKHAWPGVGETERSLQWMPFPSSLGRIETYETVGDDSLTKKYLVVPECVDTSALTWKPEGLRLFDDLDDSDEEELEAGTFPEAKDIVSLVKKRKRELQLENEENTENTMDDRDLWPASLNRKPVNHEAFRKVPKLSPRLAPEIEQPRLAKEVLEKEEVAIDQPFSALASLENFMSLRDRGSSSSKVSAHHHFPGRKPQTLQSKTVPIKPASVPQIMEPPSLRPEPSQSTVPKFTVPSAPTPFVVSTTILRDRKLVRQIQRLLPSAEFIERDFSLYSALGGASSRNSTAINPIPSSIADEADIIVSPSAGLMLTTLQKIKQRSLPGQSTKSILRERITRVAPRYEKLIIILTDGQGAPDQNDCEALMEFTAFCISVQAETQVLLTDGDSEQWMASLMVKHCIQNPGIQLIQDETLWEIFLRRAGMNAFAAQVILSELKASPDRELGTDTDHGLTAFVTMSLQQRLARFELLLGGRGLLERVSRVLDARW